MPAWKPRVKSATKLVIATDVRFWHRSTGAQRRIHSLASYLISQGIEIKVLFVGSLADTVGGYSAVSEREEIARCGFDVTSLIEDWRPGGLLNRCIWKIKCIANLLQESFVKSSSPKTPRPQPASKYLSDFSSPLMVERFQELVKRLQPDAVIVEYVTLGYLVPQRDVFDEQHPHYLIDTHDLLSERYRQFKNFGYEHWIRITRDEEAAVLKKFDTVIAIQEEEANEFKSMCGKQQTVIVTGYPAELHSASEANANATQTAEFTMGYFGSNNPSNLQALQWFMTEVWPNVLLKQPNVTLLIAGSICEAIETTQDQANVVLQNQIVDLPSLYKRFKFAINPVQFGTGLKIKNQEALAYGKPLIVTQSGAAGMNTNDLPSPIVVTKNSQQMQQAILNWVTDDAAFQIASTAAIHYVNHYLGPTEVYAPLLKRLQTFPDSP